MSVEWLKGTGLDVSEFDMPPIANVSLSLATAIRARWDNRAHIKIDPTEQKLPFKDNSLDYIFCRSAEGLTPTVLMEWARAIGRCRHLVFYFHKKSDVDLTLKIKPLNLRIVENCDHYPVITGTDILADGWGPIYVLIFQKL